ncbi:hypothetical protein [Lysobacter sp. Root604]|uniref:hypothetical protein n=1 Tax=Lysobacter sp. Root604 TaxID=1736568 RepID=UPI000B0F393E|nr:hypothetical protein [Lysobacter sp. Root604]
MSGSNRRRRGGGAPVSPCSTLTFDATVNSPQATALATLAVGDVLELTLMTGGQGVAVMKNAAIVGTLTGIRVAQMINCMNSGFDYKAIVSTLNGGQCVVRVELL